MKHLFLPGGQQLFGELNLDCWVAGTCGTLLSEDCGLYVVEDGLAEDQLHRLGLWDLARTIDGSL